MALAIFDLDGTLCDTSEVDQTCFCVVAAEMLSMPIQPFDWEQCPQVTDSGIVEWLWLRHGRGAPTPPVYESFVGRFEAALTRELERTPGRFLPIPGAASILDLLRGQGWDVAIATGGWARTARLKLRAAGLPVELLRASSDDSHDRVAIFEIAKHRAQPAGHEGHDRLVLIGDGVWDVRVADRLGWPFLGIGHGGGGARLRERGARAVIGDFGDAKAVLGLLQSFEAPLPSNSGREPR